MKIIFAGGGTAGHINPALAVAQYIRDKEPESEILYVGVKGGMEERLVKNAGFAFKGIKVSGFSRKLNLSSLKKNIVAVKRVITSSSESKKIINDFNPDVCMGTGGYVSGPILRVAAKMGIPIVIHEQNAYPGVTTKMLSKYAGKVMLSMMQAQKHLSPKCDVVYTGNPVRKDILVADKENARRLLGLDNRPVILSFGGSLGAKAVNEAVAGLISTKSITDKYQFIHAYGKYGKWFPDLLIKKGVNLKKHKNIHISEYIDNMPTCLAAADICICRSGATSLSELQVMGKPSILIPSPNVAENHQFHNAMALVNNNAAEIIEEKDLNSEKLIDCVKKLIDNPIKLKEFERNLKNMAVYDSSDRIYKAIKETLKSKSSVSSMSY